jgi:hypothetical protein
MFFRESFIATFKDGTGMGVFVSLLICFIT